MTSIDIARVRADTPSCTKVLHFNNAGSSLPTTTTLDAHLGYLKLEASIGGYEAMAAASDDLNVFYTATASLLGCEPAEVAFQSGASEAWWRAFLAVDLQPGDRVLAGTTEFQSAAFGLMQARSRGIIIDLIPDDDTGQVDLDALGAMLDNSVKLVCFTQIGMSNGLVNPAAEVGALVKATGALYLLDACQAAGQMPLDVDDLQCDFLTATGRKWLRGPRGTGLLYVRSSVLDSLVDPIFVDGRSALWDSTNTYRLAPGATRFEFGEANHAGKVGLGVAISYALDLGLDEIQDRVRMLADRLRSQLRAVPGVTVTDRGPELCGIVSFVAGGMPASHIAAALHSRSINTSAPGASDSRWMFESVGVDSVVRASPHYYNTEEEVDRVVDAVHNLVSAS
ncbi:MAG: aminotransferase class V-fold PLP-dependent enzyme [Acidimicrobiia bacterium]|nr:MAG: aminotransferase class V-fold PLP-dependent enzyme [Acidimicrobiia bacterium]